MPNLASSNHSGTLCFRSDSVVGAYGPAPVCAIAGAIAERTEARAKMGARFVMAPKMLLHATPQLQCACAAVGRLTIGRSLPSCPTKALTCCVRRPSRMHDNRRDFLRNSVLLTALSTSRILGANERVRIAGLGTGGRCSYLLGLPSKAGAEIVALCDVYEPRRLAAQEKLAPAARADYVDYREVLDRKDVDAVLVGSPDHWHVAMTLDAIQSGKDVYVEKPVSHTIAEGERLEKAVGVSRQVVQVGYQQRSWEHFQAGREVVASGKLGKITLILASWYQDYLSTLNAASPVDAQKLDWK